MLFQREIADAKMPEYYILTLGPKFQGLTHWDPQLESSFDADVKI